MPPLRISSAGGGVPVRAYDSLTLYGTIDGGGFIYCIVGVAWKVWSHAMSVIVVERVTAWGLGATRTLNGYPKGLSVKYYEANVASIITGCLTRPVM